MDSRPRWLRWLGRLSLPLEFVAVAAGLVTAWYVTDIPLSALIGTGAALVLVDLWQFLRRRYGFNRGWGKLPLGIGLLALGIYAFTSPEGLGVLKAGFVLAGAWLMLDALYDLRTGLGATAPGTPNPMERFGDAAIVGRALEDEPQSLAELDATLDLSRSRIENALDMLVDAGAIVERGGRYDATLADRGLADTLRDTPSNVTDRLGGVPARLVRPLRLFSE